MSEYTFKNLLEFIRKAPVDQYGEYNPDGFGDWSLQIYSTKRQVNVLKKTLSCVNITFPSEGTAKVYPCPRPGYCDYSAGTEWSLSTPLRDAIHGPAGEILRDYIGTWMSQKAK